MDQARFAALMKPVIDAIAGKAVDQELAAGLNRLFPAQGETFKAIEAACHAAIKAGWMCGQGAPGRRFGRVIEPGPDSRGLSVDVVQLEDIVGPHHAHPKGVLLVSRHFRHIPESSRNRAF